jgi:hypothetical protein
LSISRRTFSLFATPVAALLMLTGAANAHAAVQLDSPNSGSYLNPGAEISFSGAAEDDLIDLYSGTDLITAGVAADPTGHGAFALPDDLSATPGQTVTLHLSDTTTGETSGNFNFIFNQVPTVTATDTGVDITNAIPDGDFTVYVDGDSTTTITADHAGNYSVNLGELPGNTVTATTLDAQTNESDESSAVTVDNVAPDAPVIDSPVAQSLIATKRPDVVVSGAEAGSTVKVYVDDDTLYGSAQVPGGGGDVTVHGTLDLPQDMSWLTATATDVNDNESAASDPVSVTVDTIAPALPDVTYAPGDLSNSTQFEFNTEFSDDNAQCRVADAPGAPWNACGDVDGYSSFAPQLADGQHTVQIRALDEAGNVSPVYSHTWTLDTVAPAAATITSAPDATTTNTTATFAFTSEAGAYFMCDLDGNAGMQHSDDCDGSRTYTGLTVGKHTFKVWTIDAAGNGGPASEYTFTVTAPQAPVTPQPPATPQPPVNPVDKDGDGISNDWLVNGKPVAAPAKPAVGKVTSKSVIVKLPKAPKGSTLVVYVSTANGKFVKVKGKVNKNGELTVKGLKKNTAYEVKVVKVNKAGKQSAASKTVKVKTKKS